MSDTTDPGRTVTRAELDAIVRAVRKEYSGAILQLRKDMVASDTAIRSEVAAEDARIVAAQTKDIGRQGWGRVAALVAILVPLLPLAQALLGPLLARHDIDPATIEAVAKALERIESAETAAPAP